MDPLDFLRIAKKLLKYDSEANWRTSVSRSYYAIFNYLTQECVKMGIRISTGSNGHGELIRYLRGAGIPEAEDIGSKVDDLRTQRIQSDYYLNDPINRNTAELLYRKAEKIKDTFPAIDKQSLKSGIERYILTIDGGKSSI